MFLAERKAKGIVRTADRCQVSAHSIFRRCREFECDISGGEESKARLHQPLSLRGQAAKAALDLTYRAGLLEFSHQSVLDKNTISNDFQILLSILILHYFD